LPAAELLERHVAAFNEAVASGDWDAFVERFADDGELVFVGVPVGPFRGREAIADAYRAQPPDDAIAILDSAEVGGELVAAYAWSGEGGKAGLMILTPDGEAKLRRLVVTFDPAA
jgi:hypothetical protein